MIEKNDLYDYGFYIYQNSDFFKFSIDSILLAEFVKFKSTDSILDMCTGNAPIPLILTSKDKNLKIDAVEIQKEVYDLAVKSINENKLNNIKIYNDDIKKIELNKKYDIITCNPPYFKVGKSSLTNENPIKQVARHEIELTLENVIDITFKNLKETGTFYMVHRCERLIETINLLKNKSFGIRRLCFINTKETGYAEFFLIEASKYKKDDPKVKSINIKNLKTYKDIFKEG